MGVGSCTYSISLGMLHRKHTLEASELGPFFSEQFYFGRVWDALEADVNFKSPHEIGALSRLYGT